MADNSIDFSDDNGQDFDIKGFLIKYLRHWYWFVISVVVCLSVAFLYLRYTTPIYNVSSVLLIKDEKKGIGGNDMLKELEMFSGNKIVENEMEVLKSRNLIEKVVNDLNLTVAYFQKGKVRKYDEIFRTSPIWVQHGNLNEVAYKEPVFIRIINKQKFELQNEDGDVMGTFGYSQNIRSRYGAFRVFE
ncbi:Wzz/FepE/Etk N-terminal domain-containing protein [Pseudarcicella hirudinis]|uniref:Wzz/FepE/Etk N-terminal domain-containing protein n=1 Tax=Pseudarcicella hirudinis TaxID=1079859 RepID=UPI0035E6FDCD